MSIYGMMQTSVSGMNAQSSRLSAVADNIANSDTTGYKRASVLFSTLVVQNAEGWRNTSGAYNSGGIVPSTRYSVTQQGALEYTTSITDLAVQGTGFFIVQDASGSPFLTRAGAFIPDSNGRLVNSGGYFLTGYPVQNNTPVGVANGFAGLEPIVINTTDLVAEATTSGLFAANLPANAAAVAGSTAAANLATSSFTNKTSLATYDSLGRSVLVDLYFTKTGAETWEVAAFNQADAAAGNPFPYSAGPIATATLSFDATTGQLSGASTSSLSIAIPGGETMTLDLSGMTQFASDFTIADAKTNGSAPFGIEQVDIAEDGFVYARYANGSSRVLYKIPLATVSSPDRLTPVSGTVFSPNDSSGDVVIRNADDGEVGRVISGALEQSNVDVASELTAMIQSQRSYTANSKVFQTGSELLDVVVNLKR
ncbi:MAG: flagellar hook protein FlgE [Notoacmeibacter sp.]|nr:flagellar hook protein FlgE [Notoacmeibacter sp.]